MFTLNETDKLYASATVDDSIGYLFDGVNIIAGAEVFGGLPFGKFSDSPELIWDATPGNSVVRIICKSFMASEQSVYIHKNSTLTDRMMVSFVIPPYGGAIFSGGDLKIFDQNGLPAT